MEQERRSDRMLGCWTNLARGGDPTGPVRPPTAEAAGQAPAMPAVSAQVTLSRVRT
jgi:hypothetical protein